MTLVSVPCAVCGGTSFAEVYPSTIEDPGADAAQFFSSSRETAGYLAIVRCRACGLVLSNPRDDTETLARVYAGLADTVYESEDQNRDLDARAHLALVTSRRPPPGRLLDVGCATGIFVARAAEAGFEAAGTDASAWAISKARARSPLSRFETGTLESVRFVPASFDVITLWDVLEHVHSPRDVLQRVRGWLAPSGILCLSMPNSGSAVARAMGKRWILLLREHLWYFSPDTLGRLLSQTGFSVVDVRSKWVSFSLANVAGRLAQYRSPITGAAARAAESRLLRSASVRFPMGEMDVVAEVVG
jgi:2-polyprenyl-3-methyl-5-hydroxy-6-metoxy-1,4-benzoquinol methylase